MTSLRSFFLTASFAAALPAVSVAQQRPDAGQTLQQQNQLPQVPRSGVLVDIQPPSVATTPGGAEMMLLGLSFSGNSVYSEAELRAVLGEVTGKYYDLGGLRSLAERISAHYRAKGYPFARAFIPQQTISEGKLRIEVAEGRYGRIRAQGNAAATGQKFLADLLPGTLIESPPLERASLIIDDQPGIKSAPIIRPGQEIGTADLEVLVERTPKFLGDVGFDNHGNRYTGEHRAVTNLQWDSPFSFGDQFTARLLYSDESMWLGSIGYSAPIGSSGLRGNIGYAHTYYALAKDFASLQASGTAKVASLGVTYPIIRSQKSNLSFAATYQQKDLNDRNQSAGTDDSKSSKSLPLTLNFDRRDDTWGGGITYGSLSYTRGQLKLGSALESTDHSSGQNTRGRFEKWNLDIARVQATRFPNLLLFGRVSSQWANKNMDSSEGFTLGGANGVRAYPNGEGNGDAGWLAQFEVRYTVGSYSPYIFHDAGKVTLNTRNSSLTSPANPNHRSISGEGLGIRYAQGKWNLDTTVAWRGRGGPPQSDTVNRSPRFLVKFGYKF